MIENLCILDIPPYKLQHVLDILNDKTWTASAIEGWEHSAAGHSIYYSKYSASHVYGNLKSETANECTHITYVKFVQQYANLKDIRD